MPELKHPQSLLHEVSHVVQSRHYRSEHQVINRSESYNSFLENSSPVDLEVMSSGMSRVAPEPGYLAACPKTVLITAGEDSSSFTCSVPCLTLMLPYLIPCFADVGS